MEQPSDDDLLKAFDTNIDTTSVSDDDLMAAFNTPSSPAKKEPSQIVQGIKRGIPQMGEGFAGTAELLSKVVGYKEGQENAKAWGDYFQAKAAAIPRRVSDVRE